MLPNMLQLHQFTFVDLAVFQWFRNTSLSIEFTKTSLKYIEIALGVRPKVLG